MFTELPEFKSHVRIKAYLIGFFKVLIQFHPTQWVAKQVLIHLTKFKLIRLRLRTVMSFEIYMGITMTMGPHSVVSKRVGFPIQRSGVRTPIQSNIFSGGFD